MKNDSPNRIEKRSERVTSEVGSEGGTPGDVSVDRRNDVGVGSEAGETWRPADRGTDTVAHDESGEGRRTP